MNNFLRASTCFRAAPLSSPGSFQIAKQLLPRRCAGKTQIHALVNRRRCLNTTSNVVKPAKPVLLDSSVQNTTQSTLQKSWVDRLPRRIRPYLYLMRIDKPIGTLLLFYPCAWSITMASYATHAPVSTALGYTALFATGAFIMRGAGCTINDMWDRRLDKAVDRTKDRPLASGTITPTQAVAFLGLQLTAGLGVLLQLNWYSILLGASSLAVVTIYPFMKRITYWPQAVLGLAFNWGALLGWSAVAGTVDWTAAVPLYAGGICWTLVYDTIYAHQDKTDDVHVGIRSTALLFGSATQPVLSALSVASIACVASAGYISAMGVPFYAGTALAGAQLARVLFRTDYGNRASCWAGFVGCGWAGFWVWMGALMDFLLLGTGLW